MCGFVAVIDRAGVVVERLGRQTDALTHRGPDDRGVWVAPDGEIGLGSRRLAILDLSPRGHMPMVAAGGQVAIAFNGEIYNFRALRDDLLAAGHRFGSETDTEVVLTGYLHWGRAVVQRLDGMFGFAIYDSRDPSGPGLFVARDPSGEKPVLIHESQGRVIVASELGAVLGDERVARTLEPAALDSLLALGYLPGDASLVRGVRKLRAAHSVWIGSRGGGYHPQRYWSPAPRNPVAAEPAELADTGFAILKESVRQRLVADVPVGIFLSGGLDSSLVTAAAAAVAGRQIKTFTIAFPGGGSFDESQHAARVARHFGTEHHVLDFNGELLNEFQFVADHLDEPLGDASILPTSLVSRFARTNVTVALGGDGGDELFGGYPTYLMLEEYRRQRNTLPAGLRNLVGGMAARLPIGTKGRARFSALAGDVAAGFVERSLVFNRYDRRRLLSEPLRKHLTNDVAVEEWRRGLWPADAGCMEEAAMRTDFLSYFPDDILTKVDRASMLHSLEVRAPFLAREMLDFAFGAVPRASKISDGRTKVLLKDIARKVLPADLEVERKQGFSIPGALFGNQPCRDYALDSVAALPGDWFDKKALHGLLAGMRGNSTPAGFSFLLVLLSHWHQRYGVH